MHFPQASTIANIVATVCSLGFTLRSVWAFRRTQIMLRKGTYFRKHHPNNPDNYHVWSAYFNVAKSQRYIGLLLGSTLAGFAFVYTVTLFVVLILMWYVSQ